jgi:hypothetical protein
MIKDPFVIEKILLDHYSHLGKWFRVEDWKFESDTLDVTLTFSSLDEREFGRMSVTLIYDESEVLRFKTKRVSLPSVPLSNYLDGDCVIIVYGLDIPLKEFSSILKEYSRDFKIEEVLFQEKK